MYKLTQSDLANEISDLTQSHLSRIESGLAPLDSDLAAVFAAIFGVSTTFFAREPTADFSSLTPQLRSRSKLTKAAKNSALQWAHLIHDEYLRLLEGTTSLGRRLDPMYGATPSEAAAEVRRTLGFSQAEPLPYLLLAAERVGVRIIGLPIPVESMDAFCVWRDGWPLIAVLARAPGDRLRFSVAHELGHLILHPATRGDQQTFEAEADRFAAELLTPRRALKDLMPRHVTLRSLMMVKTQWGVSIKGLVKAARELELIDQSRAVSLYKQISARGWNRTEPGYVPVEKPRAFRKLAELKYGKGPNTQAMARDAGWSEGLALTVLDQHAREDELPFDTRASHFGNVITLNTRS
jgi:Zn-dependent peptidase ImmA (M78 family)/transcriptional regulator with XRE-family HTH domain